MAREDPQLKLRLTEEMKDRVSDAARANGRSMNAEIVARLEETLQARQWWKNPEVRDLLVKYQEATEAENEALKRSVVSLEALLLQFSHALSKAADGERAALDLLVEGEKERAFLTKVLSVSPSFEERE